MTHNRSQALALDYVIGLGVAMVLTMGLLIAGGGFIGEQREAAARTQLEVVGQQIAADLEAADRLAVSAGNMGTIRLNRQIPETIAGSQYRVELVEISDPYLELRTAQPDTTVKVEFVNSTAITGSNAGGGLISIRYTSGTLTLESGGN